MNWAKWAVENQSWDMAEVYQSDKMIHCKLGVYNQTLKMEQSGLWNINNPEN